MEYFITALKKFADFNGRARRAEFWWFFLVIVGISVVLGVVGNIIHSSIIGSIFSLAMLVPGVAVAIRRMHDINKSGWYALIPIYSIILAITEGDKGPNAYGADPKAADSDFITPTL